MRATETDGAFRYQVSGGDITYHYSRPIYTGTYEISFRDAKDREWVRMTPTSKIIRNSYAWNGNSPKKGIRIFGKDWWFGTPDFVATRPGSLSHDTDFQFGRCEHFPFSLEQVNLHYFQILSARKFALAGTYYGALKDFSPAAWNRQRDEGLHSVLL